MLKYSKSEKVFEIFLYIILGIIAFTTIYPFIHSFSISLSDRGEALRTGWHFYPKKVDLESYRRVLSSSQIWIGYANTIFRTVVGTFLSILFTIFAAYPLSKKYLPFRSFFISMIFFTMLFGGGMIPTFILIKDIGLYNNRWVYILPGIANAYNTFVMINFLKNIPASLEESARIDGAADIKVLFKIVIPLSTPVIATMALWNGVGHWNSFMDNLLYVTEKDKFVLQEVLRQILIQDRTDSFAALLKTVEKPPAGESLKMATVMVSIIPVIIAYPFLQRYFEKGVLLGSIKG
ncbi:MAG TPA: carbohydrate ABC transporter permease [Clostridiales bacterium]|nr:carbohydrate ABC transporter permease [Clostridiales bacterium]